MSHLLQDTRVALRGLRRSPAFAGTVTLILGLGIGMAVAVVSVSATVLLRRLPVSDPDQLIVLWSYRNPPIEYPVTIREVEELRHNSQAMRAVGGFAHWGVSVLPLIDGVELTRSRGHFTLRGGGVPNDPRTT